jgi:hypothetical protein
MLHPNATILKYSSTSISEVQLELPFNNERSGFQSITCKLRFIALAKSGYAGGTGRGNIDKDRIEIVLKTRSLS